MRTSGFTNAPVSRLLLYYTVAASVLVSVADIKHFFYILVVPHLWDYGQIWRLLIWQFCYANSTEVLFAAMTFYQLRVVERLWGSRKFASFILVTLPYTAFLPPILLATVVRPFSFYTANYLPAGPTALLFALLAQYHAAIPYEYKYRIGATAGRSSPPSSSWAPPSTPSSSSAGPSSTGSSFSGPSSSVAPPLSSPVATTAAPNAPGPSSSPFTSSSTASLFTNPTILFTSKTLSYVPALHLALSAVPGSLISAAVGWAIGLAYRHDALPGGASRWRVPGWMLGERKSDAGGRTERLEDLRRRMRREGEVAGGGVGSGRDDQVGGAERRRTLGGLIAEQFRGMG